MGIFAVPSPSRKPFRFFNAWKGASGVPVRSMQVRLMAGIDIQNFSGRNAEMQDAAQFDLLRALTAAATATGIDPRRWTLQPGGDGALIVLPEGLDYARIVGRLPGNLERALARLDRPGPRLRLRLAVHYLDDPAAALREFRRILMPGGAVVPSTEHPAKACQRLGGSYFAVEPVEESLIPDPRTAAQ